MPSSRLKIVYVCSAIIGLVLSIISIVQLFNLFNGPHTIEFSATLPTKMFEFKQTGPYEMAVKRSAFGRIIPSSHLCRLQNLATQSPIPIQTTTNLMSSRKSLSGDRIVSIAEFTIEQLGTYRFDNGNAQQFLAKDIFIITPKIGFKSLLFSFAIVFSATLFIGSTVLAVLSFTKASPRD